MLIRRASVVCDVASADEGEGGAGTTMCYVSTGLVEHSVGHYRTCVGNAQVGGLGSASRNFVTTAYYVGQ
eukprot:879002-Rhodomonas_salina.3